MHSCVKNIPSGIDIIRLAKFFVVDLIFGTITFFPLFFPLTFPPLLLWNLCKIGKESKGEKGTRTLVTYVNPRPFVTASCYNLSGACQDLKNGGGRLRDPPSKSIFSRKQGEWGVFALRECTQSIHRIKLPLYSLYREKLFF